MKKTIIWLIILLACQLAFAQIESRNFVNALQYYELGDYLAAKKTLATLDAEESRTLEYALLRGKTHLALGEYKDAHYWLSEYKKNSLGADEIVQKDLLQMVHDASLYQEESPLAVALGKLKGAVNSSESEYAPVLTPDGRQLYFSSLRRSEYGKENIFVSMQENMIFSEPQEVKELCTDFNESLGSLSMDGKTAYLFGYYGKGVKNGGIYQSILTDSGLWSKPSLISEVSSDYYDLQPYVHNDEIMVFTSNRHGNHLEYDIYISQKQGGVWSEPVNIGLPVNTEYDEQSPFISADGRKLYFASKGHTGYGGNDIFVSTRIGDSWTKWSEPQNMGPIVNTVKDDRYFRITPDGRFAYLSSNRAGGVGQEDIYYLDLELLQRAMDAARRRGVAFTEYNVNGTVSDNAGNPIQTNVMWIFEHDGTTYMQMHPSDRNGNFSFDLPATIQNLSYEVNHPAYKKTTARVELPQNSPEIWVDIVCAPAGADDLANAIEISGQVVDENNDPVSCPVKWSYVLDGQLHEVQVHSDLDGNFKLHIPKVAKLKYNVDEPNYGAREEILALEADQKKHDVIIRLVSLGNDIEIYGHVTDLGGNPLPANLIWSYVKGEDLLDTRVSTDSNGFYRINLPRTEGAEYRIVKTNFMQLSGYLEIPAGENKVKRDFRLARLEEEAVFQLENVEFEFNKAVLTEASIKILEPVLATLIANGSLEIELSGHTDNIGTKAVNQRLSEQRAQAVADHFVKNGVDSDRIKTMGYGLDKPIATNNTEEGRQRNRRTELKILGIEYSDDVYDDWDREFREASTQTRTVKQQEMGSAYSSSQIGIPIALEDEFRSMVASHLSKTSSAALNIALFINNGKIQAVNVYDLMGNLSDSQTEEIADLILGWKLASNQRFIYSFTVKK